MFHKVSRWTISIKFQTVSQRSSLKVNLEPRDDPRVLRKVALEYALDEFVSVFAVDQFEVELGIEHIFNVGFGGSRKLRERKDLTLFHQCLFTEVLNRLLVLFVIVDQNG